MKYILVTGGVISGIGKGIVTSSVGALLKACQRRVTAIKIDPYINVDAGTFSPYEHGEVFVLNDGCEVDLDLGNYERFLGVEMTSENNITTGKIFQQVINRERQGDYLGKTVQMVPHITDAIQDWIERTAIIGEPQPEICIIELGGTIGDIEGMPFVEALRQLRWRVKPENFCLIHVNLVPCIGLSKELKTKPTQESVHKLRGLGLSPDMIVCRSTIPLNDAAREKISYYSNLEKEFVLSLPDMKSTYSVPIELTKQGIIKSIAQKLKMNLCACNRLQAWAEISERSVAMDKEIIIALVGKYTSLQDSYLSIVKSLEHACFALKQHAKPLIRFIESEKLEVDDHNDAWNQLKSSHCVLVPGGFGLRGVEGKIRAIKWARENNIPFLGICLGFQMATVEYARNVLKINNAHSSEFAHELNTCEPIIIEMLEYNPSEKKGGTMRLGRRTTKFVVKESILRKLYGDKETITERHRHRYEISPHHIEALEQKGLRFVGKSSDETRMQILELDQSIHPYFVAVQYHPEYQSRPFNPSPPFSGLVDAALKYSESRDEWLVMNKS